MALIEQQTKLLHEHSRISVVITHNSSDSAVAEAAEENVDLYLLKPFSMDTFRQKIAETVKHKISPSDYVKKIRKGKQFFFHKELDLAQQEFLQAKPLHVKPALACYYAGHSFYIKGDQARALVEFREGQVFQALHYKCLIGEFDCLIAAGKYKEAYTLVKSIRDNYPITSQRLGQFFICAIYSSHFEDLFDFYQLFSKMDYRPPELVTMISTGLLTAGKYFVRKGEVKKACEFFDLAYLASKLNLSFLEKIIAELTKVRAAEEAQSFLAKISIADRSSALFARLSFCVDELVLNREQLAEKGRKLVMDGHSSPEIYELVVKIMVELGKNTLAETIIHHAVQDYPDMRSLLYQILSDSSPKNPA